MDYGGTNVWTDDQWQRAQKAVQEEAQRARLAAQFLPLFGPVDPTVVGVPRLELGYRFGEHDPSLLRMTVNSEPTLLMTTFSVLVYLHNREVADPELAAALSMFRRAANVIARLEDALVFNGQPLADQRPLGTGQIPEIYRVTGGGAVEGLLPDGTDPHVQGPLGLRQSVVLTRAPTGDQLVVSIIEGIEALESAGQFGPFACILSHDLFQALVTPSASIVLPRDRILPFLEGPVLRSSVIARGYGVIVALAGNGAEIVVASDLAVSFLQTTHEPRHVFRVSERVALRVKDYSALCVLLPHRSQD